MWEYQIYPVLVDKNCIAMKLWNSLKSGALTLIWAAEGGWGLACGALFALMITFLLDINMKYSVWTKPPASLCHTNKLQFSFDVEVCHLLRRGAEGGLILCFLYLFHRQILSVYLWDAIWSEIQTHARWSVQQIINHHDTVSSAPPTNWHKRKWQFWLCLNERYP